MIKELGKRVLILLSCTALASPACAQGLFAPKGPTHTPAPGPSSTLVQPAAPHLALPTQSTALSTLTLEKEPDWPYPADLVALYSHDYSEDGLQVWGAFITRDGRHLLVTLDNNDVDMVDLNSMRRESAHLGCEITFPEDISLDAQGHAIQVCSDYAGGEAFQIWMSTAGDAQAVLLSSVQIGPQLTTTAHALSPDGQYLALGFHTGEVRIYASSTGDLLWGVQAHVDNVTSLVFSPDNQFLLTDSWSFDPGTYAYDVQTGQRIATLITEGVGSPDAQSVWFSPDGRLAAGLSTTGLEIFTTSGWNHIYSLASRFWGWLGCDNRTWFDATQVSQVDIVSLESGDYQATIPTFRLFCLADQRAAFVALEASKVTLFAFPLDD